MKLRAVTAFLIIACVALPVIPAEKTYSAKSREEVEIFSKVLKAELQANHWGSSEGICFSVVGMDPSPSLIRALGQASIKVRPSGEWAKKFNCGFEVRLMYTEFDLKRVVKIESQVVDLREIIKATGHFAVLERDGEYALTKTEGKWLITTYLPKEYSAQD